MAVYYGIVVPIEEFFEVICLNKTDSKDLSKLCDMIPHNGDVILEKWLKEKDYIKYLEFNLGHSRYDISIDIQYERIKSYGHTHKTYIFLGYMFEEYTLTSYEELGKIIDKEILENKDKVIEEVKKLNLDKYEIYTFIGLGNERDRKLPDNYIPKYRKL